MPAAETFHDIDNPLIHAAAPPKGRRINAARMPAESAGHLHVMPGPQIRDLKAEATLRKGDNVAILFHEGNARLGLNEPSTSNFA